MGELITLDLPPDAPQLNMPWIITFGPVGDSDAWEPVVCGPYERAHALALAETVIADEDLTAVVEPVMPHASVEEIRQEIDAARAAAEEEEYEEGDELDVEALTEEEVGDDLAVAVDDEYDEDEDEPEDDEDEYEELVLEEVEATPPPSPEEVRAGFARIAARLAGTT